MKRAVATILAVLAIAASAVRADEIRPDFAIRTCAPKAFFEKVSRLFRKIYPDPKLEMQAAFALMPLGYPEFNGISRRANTVICGFDTDTENPAWVVGMKMEDDSRTAAFLKSANLAVYKRDAFSYLPINFGKKDPSPYIDRAHALLPKKSGAAFEADICAQAFDRLTQGKCADWARDIENVFLRIDEDGDCLLLRATILLKKNSPTYEQVNKVRRQKNAPEAQFLPQDAELFVISKMKGGFDGREIPAIGNALPADVSAKYGELLRHSSQAYSAAVKFGDAPKLLSVRATDAADAEPSVADGFSAGVKNGYCSLSNDGGMLAECLSKMSASESKTDFRLRRYAEDDSDLIVVLNNAAMLKTVLSKIGRELRDDAKINDSVASLDIALGKIDITVRADLDSLNHYCDFYRTLEKCRPNNK